MVTITIALNFADWLEGFLLAKAWPREGSLQPFMTLHLKTILFAAHLPVLQEGNKKPSTFHPLPGNANHPQGESPLAALAYSTQCL